MMASVLEEAYKRNRCMQMCESIEESLPLESVVIRLEYRTTVVTTKPTALPAADDISPEL